MNVKEEWKAKGFIDAPVDESLYIYNRRFESISLKIVILLIDGVKIRKIIHITA